MCRPCADEYVFILMYSTNYVHLRGLRSSGMLHRIFALPVTDVSVQLASPIFESQAVLLRFRKWNQFSVPKHSWPTI